MPNTTASQRSPTLVQRDGRLRRVSPDLRRARQALISNPLRPCDWKGCGCGRHALSRYCKTHHINNQRTGHPTAPGLRRGTWRPYIDLALSFIHEQLAAGHPGIVAGAAWCAGELLPQGAVVTRVVHQRPAQAYKGFLTRSRRNGTEPTDLLAYAIAAEVADDRAEASRPLFASDNHRIHQGGRLFLRAVPPALNDRSLAERRIIQPFATRENRADRKPNYRTREYTHHRVNEALGLLCLRAAEEIKRRHALNTPTTTQSGPVQGSATPFTNNT